MTRSLVPALLAWAATLAAPACSTSDGGDAARPDVEAALDVGEDVDPADAAEAGGDGESEPEGGSLTFVAESLTVLSERICDVDGDGLLDNAIAGLGSPGAELLAGAVNSAVQGQISGGDKRPIVYFPWIGDLAGPTDEDLVLLVFGGRDTDDDPSDDYSGSEPFFVGHNHLDGCGEPLRAILGVAVDSGSLSGGDGASPSVFGSDLSTHGSQVFGSVEPQGAAAEIDVCGYLLASELGATHQGFSGEEHSVLETLTAGGAAFGLPTIPGLTPDIDLDGDGLERFLLGDDGHLASCVDGDTTTIEGLDCWADERIADAFSITTRFSGVPARFAGREPGWDEGGSETCDEGPPEHSLFDP